MSPAGRPIRKRGADQERPNIYAYHAYRNFLRDWMEYLKATYPKHSLRQVCHMAGLDFGYLSKVLRGSRSLSRKALDQLGPHSKLNPAEQSFLWLLIQVDEAKDPKEKVKLLKKAHRFRAYQTANQNEMEIFEYYTAWYYIAIREMSLLEDFKLDPKWIQERLKHRVPIKEIEKAISFLEEKGYITIEKGGKVSRPDRQVTCAGEVFKSVLTDFHQEMFKLASLSIENTERERRSVTAHTMAIPDSAYAEVKEVLDDALSKIEKIGKKFKKNQTVYHVNFSAFPLTKTEGE